MTDYTNVAGIDKTGFALNPPGSTATTPGGLTAKASGETAVSIFVNWYGGTTFTPGSGNVIRYRNAGGYQAQITLMDRYGLVAGDDPRTTVALNRADTATAYTLTLISTPGDGTLVDPFAPAHPRPRIKPSGRRARGSRAGRLDAFALRVRRRGSGLAETARGASRLTDRG
ncbi:MAG: hypothetical protein ABI376_00165 [Caulobacteraceae bacterium]